MQEPHEDDRRARGTRRADGRPSARGATYAGGGREAQRRSAAGDLRGGARSGEDRPYTLYRSTPRGLRARLRGESEAELVAREGSRAGARAGTRGDERFGQAGYPGLSEDGRPATARRRGGLRLIPGLRPSARPLLHPLRLVRYLLTLCVAWVVLSAVLFFISASGDPGNLPGGAATKAALTSAGPILLTPNNILVVGLDARPRTGYSSHEGGANYSEKYANTDTLMIWRVGGGVSRKLSVPRDTLVNIPGCGMQKINAAWACGGPQETIHVVEQLTGVRINHMIVVDLGNFVKFIDDIGGVRVYTPRICSVISGGVKNGGYSLFLKPGMHTLTGVQAITLARTRENLCNPAYNDFNRELEQQRIMTGIKNQLFSLHAFLHLPWASWDAPKAVQTDMGPLSLIQLFMAAEIGGSSKPVTLGGSFGTYNGQDVVINNRAATARMVNHLLHG